MEPNISPGSTFKPNTSHVNPYTKPSGDTPQQVGEATFRPANNEDNQCLQSSADTQLLQLDGHDESIVESVSNDDHPCIQPSAARYQEDAVDSSSNDGHSCIQPYRDNEPALGPADCDITQPYAVRYQEYDDNDNVNGYPLQRIESTGQVDSIACDDEVIKPYAVAYMGQDDMECTSPKPIAIADITFTSGPTGCCSSISTPPAVSNSSQREENTGKKVERIIFGGKGEAPGKFKCNYGVAVSAENEIYVTDLFNKRIQVFSMDGVFIRLFLTAVPGEGRVRIYPVSVAIDMASGYLWVLGSRVLFHPDAKVVQYSWDGLPTKTFDVSLLSQNPHPNIAIDVRHNRVIVGEGDTIMVFQPNGSLLQGFEVLNKEMTNTRIRGVISDSEGNILLTDWYKSVKNYSHSGEKMFQFGSYGRNKGQLNLPTGLCVDTLGRIIVVNRGSNRVDMFTSRGEFVRTVANVDSPWGIAVGPGGQLVVTATSVTNSTVTILPHRVVFSGYA
ncbi:TRIM3 [Branchiostoma lanceolatum]|uniref:TRIM3 protein n=1 Tax=Branchiostoma lanceolatum TaxID=7740 RepID=A0A8K0EHC9_BRALA|nr:TRIM3 [Branchiostoma lanceolatum]